MKSPLSTGPKRLTPAEIAYNRDIRKAANKLRRLQNRSILEDAVAAQFPHVVTVKSSMFNSLSSKIALRKWFNEQCIIAVSTIGNSADDHRAGVTWNKDWTTFRFSDCGACMMFKMRF